MEKNLSTRLATAVVLAGLSVMTLAACATVSPDEMEGELSQIRQEIRQQEERTDRLEGRVDEVEQRMEQRMNVLEENLTAATEEFGGQIERMQQSIRFNIPVYFDFDDDTVRDEDHEVLERFARVVQEHYPEALVTIEGFSDPAGSRDYNIQLGQRRADAVRDRLIADGLSEGQLRTVSYGAAPDRLIVPGAAGRERGWENRRVVLVIDHSEAVRPPVPVMGL